MSRSVMAAKTKKVKTMGMKASKERALNISMQEYVWGDWQPYYVSVKCDGVAMYQEHAEYMKKWRRKIVELSIDDGCIEMGGEDAPKFEMSIKEAE